MPLVKQPFWRRPTTALLAASLLCVLAYAQVADHGFIALDDNVYIYENPVVSAGLTADGIRWAFTRYHANNWHPLTWISHMADVTLFGMKPPAPGAMKLHNVALHLVNTWLVFWIVAALGKRTSGPAAAPLRGEGGDDGHHWCAVYCAAVFALHPLHVESVAWVSERKNVLSTAFGLAALLVWIQHTRAPSRWRYAAMLGLFAASLMSKPMFVTLPCVMLLIDWWFPRQGKLRWVIVEKLPLFAMAAGVSVVTFLVQRWTGAMTPADTLPMSMRLKNAVVTLPLYLEKTFAPINLSYLYPHPGDRPTAQVLAAAAVLTVITALCLWQRRRRPWLLVGWLWFVGTMVPVIGIVQVGVQAMADRYMYVPMLGLLLALAFALRELLDKAADRRGLLAVVGCAALLVLTCVTWIQVGYWRDRITLVAHALTVDETNWMARNHYAADLYKLGHVDESVAEYRRSVEHNPANVEAISNLAVIMLHADFRDDADAYARRALALDPADDNARKVLDLLKDQSP